MPNAIELQGVTRTYGSGSTAVRALVAVDFAAATGEFVAVMGPSGSGKSTLLAIAGGLDTADDGTVRVGGQSLQGMGETERAALRRRQIGFVFQSYNLIPVLSAAENVALPLLLGGQHGRAVQERVERLLAQFGLADRATHRPAELSGGQQQRVAIARALVSEPALVLADEPTGNLDSRSSAEVLRALRAACDALGQTLVVVTHDTAVAAWADRTVFLRDGRVAGECRLGRPEPPGAGELDPRRAALVRAQYERCTGQGVA